MEGKDEEQSGYSAIDVRGVGLAFVHECDCRYQRTNIEEGLLTEVSACSGTRVQDESELVSAELETLGSGKLPLELECQKESLVALLKSLLLPPSSKRENNKARSHTPPPPEGNPAQDGTLEDAWNPLSDSRMPIVYDHSEF